MRSIYTVLIFCLFLLILPGVLRAQETGTGRRTGSSIGISFSYTTINSMENTKPHRWLHGLQGGPDMTVQYRRRYPGGFSLAAGYHLSLWFDGSSHADRLCDTYLVCITRLPMKVYQFEDNYIQHGVFLKTQWELLSVLGFRPVLSAEFRMDRVESRTRVDCEYISDRPDERLLFKGASRFVSRYSPGIAVGAGFLIGAGRLEIVPELRYLYSTAKISTQRFDEWHFTHIWQEDGIRYTYHYLQNGKDIDWGDERYTIRAFEFRILFGLRL
jgi:hypothetical protein